MQSIRRLCTLKLINVGKEKSLVVKSLESTLRMCSSNSNKAMNNTTQKRIALISVHGDPAIEIGKEEAGGQNVYVRQVGEALAKLGWQVDMFTRKASAQQAKIVEHSP